MVATTAPSRGRPRAASESEVARVALGMFIRNGYEATSMEAIARAAGISRATLFRYFTSKSEIVWMRYDEEAVELRETLAAADPEAEPLDVLCDVLPRLLQYDETERDLLRAQVTIIATVPAVEGHAVNKMGEWTGIMAEYIARRTDQKPDDLLPQVMSRCVWTAGWTALTHWARSDEETPDRVLGAAFDVIRRGFLLSALRTSGMIAG